MTSYCQSSSATSASLLQKVQANDPLAWDRFATIYTPLVYGWACRGGLQASDAEDIVQDVFRSVLAKIGEFKQQNSAGSLRGWLWVITRNRVRHFFRRRGSQAQASGGSEAAWQLAQVPDVWQRDDDPSTPGDCEALIHRALAFIRHDFSEQTWQAFWRLTVTGQSAVAIAAELKLSPSAVRQAKYRVICRLRDELAGF